MSYTICDDGDEINIRAVITQRWELAELVTKLQQRVDGLPVDITTYIESEHRVIADAGQGYDAKDVIRTQRKELSDDR